MQWEFTHNLLGSFDWAGGFCKKRSNQTGRIDLLVDPVDRSWQRSQFERRADIYFGKIVREILHDDRVASSGMAVSQNEG